MKMDLFCLRYGYLSRIIVTECKDRKCLVDYKNCRWCTRILETVSNADYHKCKYRIKIPGVGIIKGFEDDIDYYELNKIYREAYKKWIDYFIKLWRNEEDIT